jgi:hypothetical protein
LLRRINDPLLIMELKGVCALKGDHSEIKSKDMLELSPGNSGLLNLYQY